MDGIKFHFTKTVGDYDTVADNVVFKNDELHEFLIDSLDFEAERVLKILDLGCGTGHGMSLIARKFPNAKIVGMDFSARMIEKAALRLAEFGERIELIEGDFTEKNFSKGYDAIVSAVAIHNCTHEKKEILFRRIFEALNGDGVFINGDFYEHESPFLNQKLQALYRQFLEQNLSGEELQAWLRHAFEEDMPMKLSQQFQILENIGFSQIEIRWLYNNEVVYVAKQ